MSLKNIVFKTRDTDMRVCLSYDGKAGGEHYYALTVNDQTGTADDYREIAKRFLSVADLMDGGNSGTPAKPKRPVGKLYPQHRALLEYLREKGSITGVEAEAVLRIRALPRRIADLQEHGYKFDRTRRIDPTGRHYVRYEFIR